MNKARNARDELIAYLLSLTPEQAKKVLEHPAFVEVMEKQRKGADA